MSYRQSHALEVWLGDRRTAINSLERIHADVGEVDGQGRPLEIGRPVAHAYVLRVVAEFQAFARDLHDLGVSRLVELARPEKRAEPLLIGGLTAGRGIDRGNATLSVLIGDFSRLGIERLNEKLGKRNAHWDGVTKAGSKTTGDKAYYNDLIRLRNALAHGNQADLDRLRDEGVRDTVTWARARLPGLDRTAQALDRVVWEHLEDRFGEAPWQ